MFFLQRLAFAAAQDPPFRAPRLHVRWYFRSGGREAGKKTTTRTRARARRGTGTKGGKAKGDGDWDAALRGLRLLVETRVFINEGTKGGCERPPRCLLLRCHLKPPLCRQVRGRVLLGNDEGETYLVRAVQYGERGEC
jgi:hypothetical protein